MTDAGYYRGTTADQDTRFQDKQKKLLKTLKFSDVLAEPVDMRKVYKNIFTNLISVINNLLHFICTKHKLFLNSIDFYATQVSPSQCLN